MKKQIQIHSTQYLIIYLQDAKKKKKSKDKNVMWTSL